MAYTSYLFTSLSSSASIHTKGSYAQITASTPYASSRLQLTVLNGSASRLYLIDLATGGAGAEVVIVANLAVYVDGDSIGGAVFPLTVDLPAGTRLAARCQASTGSSSIALGILLEDRALGSLAAPVTYGTNTGASRGTVVDPGTTISTKGAYVQVSASTTERIDALTLCITGSIGGNVLSGFTTWVVDVATGGAGSETVVLPDIVIDGNTVLDTPRPTTMRLPLAIPAGTRLAVRCSCDRNTATERLLCVTLIGMQEPATTSGGAAGAVAYVG